MFPAQDEREHFAEYHKIDTLFERDKETFVIDPSRIKSPVLRTISEWDVTEKDVTEKIDGTNIRIMLSGTGDVSFGGRSDNASLNADLLQKMLAHFTSSKMKDALWVDGPTKVVLYGEGYGAGIQKGGAYRADKSFILFDVLVGDKRWLERKAINEVATKLETETVPYLGRFNLGEVVDTVSAAFPSKIGEAVAEGIVARPIETLFDRRGERVIIKLKTRDFIAGKR